MTEAIDYSKLPRRDVLCIDVKSFFASVEAVRRQIHPLDAYIIVISDFERPGAVVLASSPKVKKEFGIKTGSRKYEIPDDDKLMIVEPSMSLYLEVNQMICDIFRRYVADEDLLVYSIDEAFLDVSATRNLFGEPLDIAKTIQAAIWRELKLVVSVGIGDNPLLAKLALDNAAKRVSKEPLQIFQEAMANVRPVVEVRSRRVGGANYQVPTEVRPERRDTLAIRWLIAMARDRSEKSMGEKLCGEFIDASQNRGNAVKKKEDTHKMAEANRAFAHFARG